MTQKSVALITGIILYSTIFGLLLYFVEGEITIKKAVFQGVVFGVMMSLFEVFVSPKIKSFIEKRKAKKQ